MEELFAKRIKRMENGELAEIMSLVGRDDIISFAGGIPADEIFPFEKLSRLIEQLLREKGASVFQYASTGGNKLLKDYIIAFLKERNIPAQRKNILITTGSQQALDLLSKIFIDPGDKVFVEKPGYVGGIGATQSYEAELIGIEMDKNGIKIDILEQELKRLTDKGDRAKFIYLVPDFSNPSGARLSLERRKRVLELARNYDFYIIEDTPYSELYYYNEPLPFLKEMEQNYRKQDRRVIFMGSFSKFFIPGMRIGWICADQKLIELLGRAKQNTDLASNNFGQQLISLAGEEGLIDKQLERVKPYYRQKLELMTGAMEQYMPDKVIWNTPQGGFFFWLELPEDIESRELLDMAVKEGVAFVTGNSFFPKFEDGDHYARVSFCNVPEEQIEEGIRKLAEIIQMYENSTGRPC